MIRNHTTSPEKALNEKRKLSDALEHGLGKEERKIGHRRVLENGSVTYKKRLTSELMAAVQLGISQSVGSQLPSRDILYEDFHVVLTVQFPRDGSSLTPAHHCSDFCFRSYAPAVFRYFRNIFKIKPADFLLSLCSDPLKELPNPGASGSIFYVTQSDEFIIKTVQHKEAEFLQKLLPGYYMNLNQNPCTLLPKFYGLFCYQSGGKNIRFVVMNNIITSDLPLACKFDLKGSTHKRKASKNEKTKPVPTLKDLDFVATFPCGLLLEPDTHEALVKTLDRDCRVLESFKIMDYSILIGVHKVQDGVEKKNEEEVFSPTDPAPRRPSVQDNHHTDDQQPIQRPRIGQFSTPMESIQAPSLAYHSGQIPAWGVEGERLLLNVGIIDVLQSYRLSKKLEHTLKAIVHDGDSVSVHHPSFYAKRFKKFCTDTVFKSTRPGKRKSVITIRKSLMDAESMPDMMKAGAYARRQMGKVHANGDPRKMHFSDSQPSLPLLHPHYNHHHARNHLSTSSLLSTATSTATHPTDATVSFTESSPSVSSENILDDTSGGTSPTTYNFDRSANVSPYNTHPPYPIHSSHHIHQSTPTLSPSHLQHQRNVSNPSFKNLSLHSKISLQNHISSVFSNSPFSTLSSTHSTPPNSNSSTYQSTNHPDIYLTAKSTPHPNQQSIDQPTHPSSNQSTTSSHTTPHPIHPNHSTSTTSILVRINSQNYLTKL